MQRFLLPLAVLVAVALLARLAAPVGWMPTRGFDSWGLMLCPGAKPAGGDHADAPGMHGAAQHHEPVEDKPEGPRPCAFSGVFAATADLPSAAAFAPALPPAVPLSGRRPEAAVGRGLAAPPPPSHAPPVFLA